MFFRDKKPERLVGTARDDGFTSTRRGWSSKFASSHRKSHRKHLPFGYDIHSLPWLKSPCLSSVNHLFLWAIYTMAMLVITRGYLLWSIPLAWPQLCQNHQPDWVVISCHIINDILAMKPACLSLNKIPMFHGLNQWMSYFCWLNL